MGSWDRTDATLGAHIHIPGGLNRERPEGDPPIPETERIMGVTETLWDKS
jgi:hypothetical protein